MITGKESVSVNQLKQVLSQSGSGGGITTDKIADGAVTEEKLADDVKYKLNRDVGLTEIPDNSVTSTKIADGAVTARKFATDIDFGLTGGTFLNLNLQDSYIEGAEIRHPNIISPDIISPSFSKGINGDYITDASITENKLSDAIKQKLNITNIENCEMLYLNAFDVDLSLTKLAKRVWDFVKDSEYAVTMLMNQTITVAGKSFQTVLSGRIINTVKDNGTDRIDMHFSGTGIDMNLYNGTDSLSNKSPIIINAFYYLTPTAFQTTNGRSSILGIRSGSTNISSSWPPTATALANNYNASKNGFNEIFIVRRTPTAATSASEYAEHNGNEQINLLKEE